MSSLRAQCSTLTDTHTAPHRDSFAAVEVRVWNQHTDKTKWTEPNAYTRTLAYVFVIAFAFVCKCVKFKYPPIPTQALTPTCRTYVRKRIATATSRFVIEKSKNVFSKHRHCKLNTARCESTRFSIRSHFFWKIPLFICLLFFLSFSNF